MKDGVPDLTGEGTALLDVRVLCRDFDVFPHRLAHGDEVDRRWCDHDL